MVRNNYLFFFVVVCSLSIYIFSESFTIKKPKRVSSNKIKQDIGQLQGELLQLSASLIKKIAHMQEGIIEKTYELIEQNTESFFAKADNVQLQNYCEQLELLLKKMRNAQAEQTDGYQELQKMFLSKKSVNKTV